MITARHLDLPIDRVQFATRGSPELVRPGGIRRQQEASQDGLGLRFDLGALVPQSPRLLAQEGELAGPLIGLRHDALGLGPASRNALDLLWFDHCLLSSSSRSRFTRPGLPWPFVARITWPTRNPKVLGFPARKSARALGLASMTP